MKKTLQSFKMSCNVRALQLNQKVKEANPKSLKKREWNSIKIAAFTGKLAEDKMKKQLKTYIP